MAKIESPIQALADYLPQGAFELVEPLIRMHRVHLTITKGRSSILGDYRHAYSGRNHRISVNGNLNVYSFLITLLHELGHMQTYLKYGPSVVSHGKEWKHEYAQILRVFLEKSIFPNDVRDALLLSLKNPAASTCAEEGLMRVLRAYDAKRQGYCLIEELPDGAVFKIQGNRIFRKGERQRKRYLCLELATGKKYVFSPVYEVCRISDDCLAGG